MVEKEYNPKLYKNKQLDNKSGIYQIRNLTNNKLYIGSSINLLLRKKQHFSDLRHNRHNNIYLQNSFNKHGEHNFVFEVIEFCNKDFRLDLEQYWLDIFKYKSCYNISPFAHCPTIRYGIDNNKSTKVICLDDNKVFISLNEASEEYGIDRRIIGNCCRKINKATSNGLHFMYYNDYLNSSSEYVTEILNYNKQSKPVICLENKEIYKNVTEASNILKINKGNIFNCCNHTRWTVSDKNLHFLYLEEYKKLTKSDIDLILLQKNGYKPVINLDTLEVFKSKLECANNYNLNPKTIYIHCNNLVKSPRFMFYNDYIKNKKLDVKA